MQATPIDLLQQISDAVLESWRAGMDAAGFTGEIYSDIEYVLPGGADRARLPLIRRLLEQRSEAWARYCLLFNYDGALQDTEVRTLLGEQVHDALRAAAVLVPDAGNPGHLRSTLRIMPFLGLWILGDPPDADKDAVMVPGQTTMQLALLMPPGSDGDVLDLGCGPGALALIAAQRGARNAVGVDINVRAVRMARVNARLNQLNAQFLDGDMYEPVQGRRFNLVVAQPPYVIQPDDTRSVVFLHAGPRGEDLMLRALAGLPAMLAPGGRGVLLADAALPAAGNLTAHYRRALAAPDVDLVVATAPAPPIEVQAFAYAQVDDESLGARYAATASRYLDHLRTLDPPGFRHAAVLLRKPDAQVPGRQALTAGFPVSGFGGAASRNVDDFFNAVDLAAAAPAVLRKRKLHLSKRARWTVEGDTPVVEGEVTWKVRFDPGALGVDQSLSQTSATILHFVDTAPTVDESLAQYASACEVAVEEIAAKMLDFVRHALRTGLLEPANPTQSFARTDKSGKTSP